MTDHFSPLTNHLWQSTLFTALVAIVALALRNNHAKTRYWLWLAASLKFLIPFSLLVSLGTRVEVPAVAPMMPALAVEQITTSFAPVAPMQTSAPQSSTPSWPKFAAAVWLFGAVILLGRWFRRWLIIRKAFHAATPLPLAAPIPILSSRTTIEPGVFGIFRPVLLLPEGITNNLSAQTRGHPRSRTCAREAPRQPDCRAAHAGRSPLLVPSAGLVDRRQTRRRTRARLRRSRAGGGQPTAGLRSGNFERLQVLCGFSAPLRIGSQRR